MVLMLPSTCRQLLGFQSGPILISFCNFVFLLLTVASSVPVDETEAKPESSYDTVTCFRRSVRLPVIIDNLPHDKLDKRTIKDCQNAGSIKVKVKVKGV